MTTRLFDSTVIRQAHEAMDFMAVDGLITVDPEGFITDVNKQMCRMTGYAREELVGSPFKRYFTDPSPAEDGIRLVLREGDVTNYELTARGKDGRETGVSYNAATFDDRDGKPQGVFAAARDVTERKRFEQTLQEKNIELEDASLAKDRFLASMSHELRTPLDAIIPETFVGQVEAFLRPGQRSALCPPPPAAPAPAPLPRGRTTVLVVDNSPVDLSLMRSTLEPFGYAVITASNASEALTLMRQSPPDLILSDVHMPGQSGYDLIGVVKADPQLSPIPFAFISSAVWQRDRDCARGRALGAVKFIMRPIEPQGLLAEIDACLQRGGGTGGNDFSGR